MDWGEVLGGVTALATAVAAVAAWKAASRAADATEELVKLEEDRDVRSRTLDVSVSLGEEACQVRHSDATETVFTITVNNQSEFPIKVIGVAVVGYEERVRSYLVGEESDLPRTVASRDAEVIDLPLSAILDSLPRGMAQGWVQLSTGEELRSPATDLPTIRNQGA